MTFLVHDYPFSMKFSELERGLIFRIIGKPDVVYVKLNQRDACTINDDNSEIRIDPDMIIIPISLIEQ